MADPGKQLFRKESLERLSSPEKLDELMKVVNRRAWLPLATMGSLVFVATLWSIFGRIPLTIAGKGVLIYPSRVEQLQAPSNGRLLNLNITSGSDIKKGQVIGQIDQYNLNLELEQEKEKLRLLKSQNQETDSLEKQRIALERENLVKQRNNLQETLQRTSIEKELRDKNLQLIVQNRQSLNQSLINYQLKVPELYRKNIVAIETNRQSLELNLNQLKESLPKLEQRLKERENLLKKQLITGDVLLQAEQDLFTSRAQIADLASKLKQLEVDITNTQTQDLQNRNQIDQIRSQLKQLNVQETDIQKEYLQSLNTINNISIKIQEIDALEAKLKQEQLGLSLNKDNKIKEISNKIDQLEKELQQKSQIISEENGKVLEIGVVNGQIISMGTRIASIEVEDYKAKLISLVYFADKDGKQIKPGMIAQVTPSIVKRERYGGIIGKVKSISPFPVTSQDIAATIGNEEVAKIFSQDGAPIQVLVELEENPNNSKNGYKWSSSDGPEIKPSSGTSTDVRITVGQVTPISYVIPIFRSWTGTE